MKYEISFKNGKSAYVTRQTLDSIIKGIDEKSDAQFQTVWERNEGSTKLELCIMVNVLEITCITPLSLHP